MDELEPQASGGATGKVVAARDFFVATRHEMDKVSWPSRPELTAATRAVVLGALGLGVVIGVLDWILAKILVDGVAVLER